jgi:K+-transporting ATPase c subunit
MKPFELFKAGRHTASGGASLSFSAEDLQAAVAAYDPAVHEAPIVVGHPKDNAPAYGWIKSLSFADGSITAEPAQVDADFAEMVKAGRFKKRSASFYTADAPNNPKPGSYYLRHVGFLGAQPPAVKGLKEVAFSDAEEGVVEFSDYEAYGFSTIAGLFRGLREWLIAEKGVDAADKAIPNYLIGSVDDAAKQAADSAKQDAMAGGAMPAFSEGDDMNIQQLQAEVTRLTAENTALKASQLPADFAERQTNLAAREAAVAAAQAKADRATVEARVDAAVKAGRLLPAQKKHAVDFAMALTDGDAVIEFGEGDKAKKVSQREAYLLDIESRGKVIEFGELSSHTDTGDGRPPIHAVQQTLADQVFSGGKKAAA